MYVKVKDYPNLMQDTTTQAILNTDLSAVKRHEERISRVNKELKRDSDITELRSEINQIKSLLIDILNKR